MIASVSSQQQNRFYKTLRQQKGHDSRRATTAVTNINSNDPESDARRARMRGRYLQLRAEYMADGRIGGLEALEPSRAMTPDKFVALLLSDKKLPTGKS